MAKVTSIGSPDPSKVKAKQITRQRSAAAQMAVDQGNWENATLAMEMRLEGKQLSEIAAAIGYKNIRDVDRLFSERFAHDASFLTNQQRTTMMGWEMMRLDRLQAAVWPAAMMGDPKSVDSAVRIIMARAKIAGLDQVDPVVQKNLVLVVGEKEEDYIAALKAAGSDD